MWAQQDTFTIFNEKVGKQVILGSPQPESGVNHIK